MTIKWLSHLVAGSSFRWISRRVTNQQNNKKKSKNIVQLYHSLYKTILHLNFLIHKSVHSLKRKKYFTYLFTPATLFVTKMLICGKYDHMWPHLATWLDKLSSGNLCQAHFSKPIFKIYSVVFELQGRQCFQYTTQEKYQKIV